MFGSYLRLSLRSLFPEVNSGLRRKAFQGLIITWLSQVVPSNMAANVAGYFFPHSYRLHSRQVVDILQSSDPVVTQKILANKCGLYHELLPKRLFEFAFQVASRVEVEADLRA
jgi:hypothetical protein